MQVRAVLRDLCVVFQSWPRRAVNIATWMQWGLTRYLLSRISSCNYLVSWLCCLRWCLGGVGVCLLNVTRHIMTARPAVSSRGLG